MNEQIDSSIPVLTEIIHAPNGTHIESAKAHSAASPVITKPSFSQAAVSGPQSGLNFAPQALIRETSEPSAIAAPIISASLPTVDSEEWMLLEQSVRENVLKHVLSRVDFVLEHRVSDSLADVLQKAVDQLADDIRTGLKKSIEEVVTRAVNQEITKLKGTRS